MSVCNFKSSLFKFLTLVLHLLKNIYSKYEPVLYKKSSEIYEKSNKNYIEISKMQLFCLFFQKNRM